MQENNKKYDINKFLNIFEKISNVLGGMGSVSVITLNPDEFSIYINKDTPMILINELNALQDIIEIDTIFFDKDRLQLILTNTNMTESLLAIQNEDIKYLMDFVKECANFICPCTGSEIQILDGKIKIIIGGANLLHNEYIGVYNLLNEETISFSIVFDIHKPYISIKPWEYIS